MRLVEIPFKVHLNALLIYDCKHRHCCMSSFGNVIIQPHTSTHSLGFKFHAFYLLNDFFFFKNILFQEVHKFYMYEKER